ncbi:hypothetical protein L218DRAFT_591684 [Marasmius fiardii PR-910]|nr:hypothetical protein L218DRAFT_591684 [Marasmius fiardii PR-910]
MADTSTQKFQKHFPALLALSPQLSALHNSRNLRNHTNETETPLNLCSKCGAFLYCHPNPIRLVRSKSKREGGKSTSMRFLECFCGNCGYLNRRVVENDNPASFPRRKRERMSVSMSSAPSVSEPSVQTADITRGQDFTSSSSSPTPFTTTPKLPAHELKITRNRPKKKSGLQEMLARNRKREEKEKEKVSTQNCSRLGAFLSGL